MKLNRAEERDHAGRFARGEADRGHLGYTMVEVLVAVLILGTMVISLYGGFTAGFGAVRLSRDELRATQILTRQVEALRLRTWSQLSSLSLQDSYGPPGAAEYGAGTVFGVTVATNAPESIPDDAPYKNDVRLVTVTVSWTNLNGETPIVHSRQMQTHIARYGLQNYSWGATP